MTLQIDAKMACVELTKTFGLDIVSGHENAIIRRADVSKNSGNSEHNSGRAAVMLFAERRWPRIPAANAASIADNLPRQQQKQQRVPGSSHSSLPFCIF